MSAKAITILPQGTKTLLLHARCRPDASSATTSTWPPAREGKKETGGEMVWTAFSSRGRKGARVRASERAACHRDAPAALSWVGSGIVGSSLAPSLVGLLRREERWADGWVG